MVLNILTQYPFVPVAGHAPRLPQQPPCTAPLAPVYFLFSYHVSVYTRSRFTCVFFRANTVKYWKCYSNWWSLCEIITIILLLLSGEGIAWVPEPGLPVGLRCARHGKHAAPVRPCPHCAWPVSLSPSDARVAKGHYRHGHYRAPPRPQWGRSSHVSPQ